MREHKYRAWDKENKIMIYNIEDKPAPLGDTLNEWINDKRFEVTEYTGLKDKNSKNIYEGDIVEWIVEKSLEDRYVIEWEKGSFFLGDNHLIDIKFGEFEVIGNVYENPELNKEKNE